MAPGPRTLSLLHCGGEPGMGDRAAPALYDLADGQSRRAHVRGRPLHGRRRPDRACRLNTGSGACWPRYLADRDLRTGGSDCDRARRRVHALQRMAQHGSATELGLRTRDANFTAPKDGPCACSTMAGSSAARLLVGAARTSTWQFRSTATMTLEVCLKPPPSCLRPSARSWLRRCPSRRLPISTTSRSIPRIRSSSNSPCTTGCTASARTARRNPFQTRGRFGAISGHQSRQATLPRCAKRRYSAIGWPLAMDLTGPDATCAVRRHERFLAELSLSRCVAAITHTGAAPRCGSSTCRAGIDLEQSRLPCNLSAVTLMASLYSVLQACALR